VFRVPIERDGSQPGASSSPLASDPSCFVARKRKSAPELPPKTEITQLVDLAGAQLDLYESIRLAMHERVRLESRPEGLRPLDDRRPRGAVAAPPGVLRSPGSSR
jgi:non-specific serine/threonine protein kinase